VLKISQKKPLLNSQKNSNKNEEKFPIVGSRIIKFQNSISHPGGAKICNKNHQKMSAMFYKKNSCLFFLKQTQDYHLKIIHRVN